MDEFLTKKKGVTMPSNNKPTRTATWKKNISRSMLVNRLISNATGELPNELTSGQIKSIEILLRKTIPDLKAIEHKGSIKATYEQSLKQVLEEKEVE